MRDTKITDGHLIPKEYKQTPIEALIKYQNFKAPFKNYNNAQMLAIMCMDNRKQLTVPQNFTYIIRTGGANIRNNEFQISDIIQ